MAKVNTCGVLIREPRGILLGHVTYQNHWDIPKGHSNFGESPIHAAVRETQEETNLLLRVEDLRFINRYRFGKRRDLYLYEIVLLEEIDLSKLFCSSMVEGYTPFPEIDNFCVEPIDKAVALVSPRLAEVLLSLEK